MQEVRPCPFLPTVDRQWRAVDLAEFRSRRDAHYYVAALSFAQSLWLEGKPAQALLQCNKSFLADFQSDFSVLKQWPAPYAAKRWLIGESLKSDAFLGNPVRHYQHLATRMSGPFAKIRSWRAWACFHLAESILPPRQFPRDQTQINKERIVIPTLARAEKEIEKAGWPGELATLRHALNS